MSLDAVAEPTTSAAQRAVRSDRAFQWDTTAPPARGSLLRFRTEFEGDRTHAECLQKDPTAFRTRSGLFARTAAAEVHNRLIVPAKEADLRLSALAEVLPYAKTISRTRVKELYAQPGTGMREEGTHTWLRGESQLALARTVSSTKGGRLPPREDTADRGFEAVDGGFGLTPRGELPTLRLAVPPLPESMRPRTAVPTARTPFGRDRLLKLPRSAHRELRRTRTPLTDPVRTGEIVLARALGPHAVGERPFWSRLETSRSVHERRNLEVHAARAMMQARAVERRSQSGREDTGPRFILEAGWERQGLDGFPVTDPGSPGLRSLTTTRPATAADRPSSAFTATLSPGRFERSDRTSHVGASTGDAAPPLPSRPTTAPAVAHREVAEALKEIKEFERAHLVAGVEDLERDDLIELLAEEGRYRLFGVDKPEGLEVFSRRQLEQMVRRVGAFADPLPRTMDRVGSGAFFETDMALRHTRGRD